MSSQTNYPKHRDSTDRLNFISQEPEFESKIKEEGKRKFHQALTYITLMTITLVGQKLIFERDLFHNKRQFNSLLLCIGMIAIKLLSHKFERILAYTPFLLISAGIVVITESSIIRSPQSFRVHEASTAIPLVHEYLHLLVGNRTQTKIFSFILIQCYYILRNYIHYEMLEETCIYVFVFNLVFYIFLTRHYDTFLDQIIILYSQKQKLTEEIFEKTLDTIPQGILVLSTNDLNIMYKNSELEKKLQVDNLEHLIDALQELGLNEKQSRSNNQSTYEPFSPINNADSLFPAQSLQDSQKCDHPKFFRFLQDYNFNKNKKVDAIFKRKGNKKQYFQVKSQMINKRSQIIAIFNDITRIKELESITYKMKSMFFSSIAHELRTPLNTIIPMSQRLQGLIMDEQCMQYLKIIISSSFHLQSIIEDALDMSRIENNKFEINYELFNIRQVLKEVSSIMEFQIQLKKLKYEVIITEQVPDTIRTDQKRYKQILFNLIGNAIKFTFKGFIKVVIDFYDNKLTTIVEDSGIGITREDQTKLFKFFGQLQNSKKINKGGMGLGLTISKLILQELKGDISVISEFNKGSQFQFYVPIEKYERGHEHYPRSSTTHLMQTGNKQRSFKRYSMEMPQFVTQQILRQNQQPSDSTLVSLDTSSEEIPSDKLGQFFIDHNIRNNFIPYLNLRQSLEEIKEVEDDRISYINAKRLRLLLVDDSAYNLFVIEELIKDMDIVDDIQTAMNGYDAIEKCSQLHKTSLAFDIIFLDLHMPVLDGFQTIEKLKEMEKAGKINLSKTKIIAVSAITQEQFKSSQNSHLFNQFLEKPLDFQKLKQILYQ